MSQTAPPPVDEADTNNAAPMPTPAPPAASQPDTAAIDRLFKALQSRAIALRSSEADARIAKLRRLRDAVIAESEAIFEACAADFGKPAAEVDVTEILPVVAEANHAIRRVKRWMKPERRAATLLMFGTAAEVRHEPKGTCLLISPWNYPINLTLAPLVSAIAAGNTVLIKPSELTPHCSAFLHRLIDELYAEDEIAVVEGGVETAQYLLAKPFDHIFFTGSPAIGKQVMAAAAANLTSVTLELGGKSPVIVDKSADIKQAARRVVWGKFANNGQTCIAPDYVYVHADIQHAFIESVRNALDALYGRRSDMESNPDYCRIVNAAHYQRLSELVADAAARGALLPLGATPDNDSRFIAPTLLTDVPDDARIMREEIFGPVLPILAYTEIQEAIEAINARPKPLALYIFSRDNTLTERALTQTSAGGSCVNQVMLHYLHTGLPFGGVNHSGIGKAHGRYGFEAFSNARSVLRERFSLSFLFLPPYTRFTRWFIRFAVRWLN